MADEKVVHLQDRVVQKAAATGEWLFMRCSCAGEEGYAVVAVHDAFGPLITSLACMTCGAEVPVIMGRPKT